MNKELDCGVGMAVSIGWAIFWRVALLNIIYSYAYDYYLGATPIGSSLLAVIVNFIVIFLIFVASSYWLFKGGRIGSMKIIFMEQADYQKIISNNSLQDDAEQPRA